MWGVSTVGRTRLPYFIPKTVKVGQAVNGESAQNLPRKFGALAQLVARNVRIVEVRGSNPLRSTIRCKSEPILLCEERLRVCERNRGHGMSRDLFLVIRGFSGLRPYE